MNAAEELRREGWKKGRQEGLEQGILQGLKKGREQGLDQGREQGLDQGREQGLEQGREQGLRRGRQETLLKQLTMRFGPVPERFRRRVRRAKDSKLDLWTERVLSARTLDEVFDSKP